MAIRRNTSFPKEASPEELKWIERITDLLDSKFTIPGTKIKFGLDPIIGIIPGFGDVASFSISALMVLSMVRNGASREVAIKMLMNLGVDTITGIVPVLGGLFDVFYKANRRNYNLLKQHQVEGKHQGKGWPLLIGVAIVIVFMLFCLLYGMFAVSKFIIGLF